MMSDGQLLESLLYFLLSGAFLDPHHVIVVVFWLLGLFLWLAPVAPTIATTTPEEVITAAEPAAEEVIIEVLLLSLFFATGAHHAPQGALEHRHQ
jgi:hypothetical protein